MAEVNNFASKIEMVNHLRKVFRLTRELAYDEVNLKRARKKLLSVSPATIEKYARVYQDDSTKLEKK